MAEDYSRTAEELAHRLGTVESGSPRADHPPLDLPGIIGLALGDSVPTAGVAVRGNPLTARQQQIAELIAEGLSNRSIAESLVISPRTVGSHVEHILAKLDFSSRTQIATWFFEQSWNSRIVKRTSAYRQQSLRKINRSRGENTSVEVRSDAVGSHHERGDEGGQALRVIPDGGHRDRQSCHRFVFQVAHSYADGHDATLRASPVDSEALTAHAHQLGA
nr:MULTISPECIES: LuxR C-terminal-related transcriptional regulator [unclassified Rhodococcus (in: high G+C Gram-positive bacteria)]